MKIGNHNLRVHILNRNFLHMKQPIKDEVAENMNIAEMAVTVVPNMFDKSRMVGPFTPSMIP